MKIIAINSSPRKDWNTAMVLKKALEGAASAGAETEFIHLNDLNYKGARAASLARQREAKTTGNARAAIFVLSI